MEVEGKADGVDRTEETQHPSVLRKQFCGEQFSVTIKKHFRHSVNFFGTGVNPERRLGASRKVTRSQGN